MRDAHVRQGREGVRSWRSLELGEEEPIPKNNEHMSLLNLEHHTKPIDKLHLTQTSSSLKEANWPSGC